MKKIRIDALYEPHFFNKQFSLAFDRLTDSFSDNFEDCMDSFIEEGDYFSDDVMFFIKQVFSLSPLSLTKQEAGIQAMLTESKEIVRFYIQQPSESIERLFIRVHKVILYLIIFYGNVSCITMSVSLWRFYIFNSKLQQDLTAIYYKLSLLKTFSLSLFSQSNLDALDKKRHIKHLKKVLLDNLLSLRSTETLRLVQSNLQVL